MAEALIRYETLDSGQIDQIMAGGEPDPPEGWSTGGSSKDEGEEKGSKEGRPTIGGPAEQL